MKEYKPMKWYQSEFIWLLISILWQIFWFTLYGLLITPEYFLWIGLIGTAYFSYFITKSVIYAWIINPYKSWKKINRK